MKNKKNRQWNKYYFTITLKSTRNTKPVILRDILAHSKEHAYMKLIKYMQYWGIFERYNIRTIRIIYVDTNINMNDINDICCMSKNGLISYYKTCRNNKLVDIKFQSKCPNYDAHYGTCVLTHNSCKMIHTNYCDEYIDVMLQNTMFHVVGGVNK